MCLQCVCNVFQMLSAMFLFYLLMFACFVFLHFKKEWLLRSSGVPSHGCTQWFNRISWFFKDFPLSDFRTNVQESRRPRVVGPSLDLSWAPSKPLDYSRFLAEFSVSKTSVKNVTNIEFSGYSTVWTIGALRYSVHHNLPRPQKLSITLKKE